MHPRLQPPGREEQIKTPATRLAEANTINTALESASLELKERAKRNSLLLHELSHRVKNVLAVVQAIAMRTFPKDGMPAGVRDAFFERLQALGRAHELLIRTDWSGAPLREIVMAELEPYAGRTEIGGPDLIMDGAMVQTLALLLHELVTNALKHGALSNDTGRVRVAWAVHEGTGQAQFKFRWEERGGPAVKPPIRRGFGSALLEGAIQGEHSASAKLTYDPDGFVYELDAPLSASIVHSAPTSRLQPAVHSLVEPRIFWGVHGSGTCYTALDRLISSRPKACEHLRADGRHGFSAQRQRRRPRQNRGRHQIGVRDGREWLGDHQRPAAAMRADRRHNARNPSCTSNASMLERPGASRCRRRRFTTADSSSSPC